MSGNGILISSADSAAVFHGGRGGEPRGHVPISSEEGSCVRLIDLCRQIAGRFFTAGRGHVPNKQKCGSSSEEGSYLRLIDLCITQLEAGE